MLLAKAQTLYPVQVCHFQWMGNHFHLILAGRAAAVSSFMGFFQGEIAKYIKLIVPKFYQTKFWKGRFKEQKLCTAQDVINKIIYIYANPARAGLVESIFEWPGVSSWKMYTNGSNRFCVRFVEIKDFKKIARRICHMKDAHAAKELRLIGKASYEFSIFPNVWKRCFKESALWTDEYIRETVVSGVAEREKELDLERGSKPVLGVNALKNQSITQPYEPKDTGGSPFLICHDLEIRKQCIESYKLFCKQCREAWEQWKKGMFDALFPSGCYRPGTPVVAAVTMAPA